MRAKLYSEQYFGMANRKSMHGKNIAHGSEPDMVKISQYVFCTLTQLNSLCFSIAIKARSESLHE